VAVEYGLPLSLDDNGEIVCGPVTDFRNGALAKGRFVDALDRHENEVKSVLRRIGQLPTPCPAVVYQRIRENVAMFGNVPTGALFGYTQAGFPNFEAYLSQVRTDVVQHLQPMLEHDETGVRELGELAANFVDTEVFAALVEFGWSLQEIFGLETVHGPRRTRLVKGLFAWLVSERQQRRKPQITYVTHRAVVVEFQDGASTTRPKRFKPVNCVALIWEAANP
jgi:hypothetical protein